MIYLICAYCKRQSCSLQTNPPRHKSRTPLQCCPRPGTLALMHCCLKSGDFLTLICLQGPLQTWPVFRLQILKDFMSLSSDTQIQALTLKYCSTRLVPACPFVKVLGRCSHLRRLNPDRSFANIACLGIHSPGNRLSHASSHLHPRNTFTSGKAPNVGLSVISTADDSCKG